jgi:GNAT superfamily N-acetyltransferase
LRERAVPVIGRLAVDRAHAGRGIGVDTLADALRRIAVTSQSIGVGAAMVQAKSETAQRRKIEGAIWKAGK